MLDACVDELAASIDRVEGWLRRAALGALLDIAVWERQRRDGGFGARAALLLLRIAGDEREALAEAVECSMLQESVGAGGRHRLEGLVLALRSSTESATMLPPIDPYERISMLLAHREPKAAAAVLTTIEDWGTLRRCVELFDEYDYPEWGRGPGRVELLTRLHAQAVRTHQRVDAARWAEEVFQEASTVERWMWMRASVKKSRRVRLRWGLYETGQFMLLVEILLAEGKAREALVKFRRVQERTPRALAPCLRIVAAFTDKPPKGREKNQQR